MKIALHTLGCRANQADSLALIDALRALDVTIVDKDTAADVHILNSCTVTHSADAGARKLARRLKRRDPNARVIVTGCYAQVNPEALRALPEVDLVVGNDGKTALADRIVQGLHDERSAPNIPRTPPPSWEADVRAQGQAITPLSSKQTRPFLKVQDGCDYRCAYCIIPTARGASRSISPAKILKDALGYAALGAKEIVLTGIHLGHWGRDLHPRRPFVELLRELADALESDGRVARLRLGSIEPNEVTPELVELVASHPLLCEHFHVPMQSGDDGVLRRMRRLYRSEDFAHVVDRIRARLPRAALGIDVLVGHPGEDEAAFETTRRFLEELDFTYLHTFPFSARANTPAATMKDAPSPQDKTKRVAELQQLSESRRRRFFESMVGQRAEALVLQARDDGGHSALTRNFAPLHIPPGDETVRSGALIEVKLMAARSVDLLAHPIEPNQIS